MNIVGEGSPVRVTAHLSSPIIGMDRVMLDGPVAWAWVMLAKAEGRIVPAITAEYAPDFPLPFSQWMTEDTWGWCVSKGTEDCIGYTTVQIRRRPAVYAMARFAPDRSHHAGLGPFKARDVALPARIVPSITWHCLVTDKLELFRLLRSVTNISSRWRNGFGRVESWDVDESTLVDAWMDRPLPAVDGTRSVPVRPPYWHPSRMALCD